MTRNQIFLLLFILLSCGKRVKEDSVEETRQTIDADGTYRALLVPVNKRITSEIHGEVKIHKYGDEFQVNVKIKNALQGRYRQHLHTGSFCPKTSQDINADGYIDSYEARQQTGYVLLPFDGDLSSQQSGGDLLLQGNYSYTRSTSYHLMLADLHLPDEIVNDDMVKMTDRELSLERKTVMIYAVRSKLPSTVTGTEVPVACGILTRISDTPLPPDDEYQEETESRPRPRPRPVPRPVPQEPLPDPEPEPQPENRTWWDRVIDWWMSRTGG